MQFITLNRFITSRSPDAQLGLLASHSAGTQARSPGSLHCLMRSLSSSLPFDRATLLQCFQGRAD